MEKHKLTMPNGIGDGEDEKPTRRSKRIKVRNNWDLQDRNYEAARTGMSHYAREQRRSTSRRSKRVMDQGGSAR